MLGYFVTRRYSSNIFGLNLVGYQIIIVYMLIAANIIALATVKYRTVVRSALGFESLELFNACDSAIFIRHDVRLVIK